MHIVVINGPNLNLLGSRQPKIYGNLTYKDLCNELQVWAKSQQIELTIFQSNHEGAIVDFIQKCPNNYDAIIINAAAYTHTSIAILDALLAVKLPAIEVHLSDITKREEFRQISYLSQACLTRFCGEGLFSYQKALLYLIEELKKTDDSPQ